MAVDGGVFGAIAAQEFAVLTTYRRSGEAVPTTVWFAVDGDKVFITTQRDSGKVKRVRNDGRVLLTPSDRTGNLLGEPGVAGMAREGRDDERERAWMVLSTKYGEAWTRLVGETDERPDSTYLVVEAG